MKYQETEGDFSPIPSISKSLQPHKFFERMLDNDLKELSDELKARYRLIEEAKVLGVTPVREVDMWKETGSVSTMKWRQYNVFQFHIDGLYKLYKAVGDMTREACDYYGINFEEQQFMLQGWFNVNEKDGGRLNWHEHGSVGAPQFHGYYCVNAEPSVTKYLTFNEYKDNINVNNRAVLSEMGHPHAVGEWNEEEPRITVAFDVLPLRSFYTGAPAPEQHWIPLN